MNLFWKAFLSFWAATVLFYNLTLLPLLLMGMIFFFPDASWPISFVAACVVPVTFLAFVPAWVITYVINDPRSESADVRASRLQILIEDSKKWMKFGNLAGWLYVLIQLTISISWVVRYHWNLLYPLERHEK